MSDLKIEDQLKDNYLIEEIRKTYPLQLEEILTKNDLEWMNVNDAIKLSFKYILDIFKQINSTLSDMDLKLRNYVEQDSFQLNMENKVDNQTQQQSMEQISLFLENRPSFQELDQILAQQPSHQYQDKSQSINIDKTTEEFDSLYKKLDEVLNKYEDIDSKFVKHDDREIKKISEMIDRSQLESEIEKLAKKKSVSTALHQKLNKSDFENFMALKADNSKFESLDNKVKSKLDTHVFNQQVGRMVDDSIRSVDFSKLRVEMEGKADCSQINALSISFEAFKNNQINIKTDLENQIKSVQRDINKFNKYTETFNSITEFDRSLKSMFDHFEQSKKMQSEFQAKFESLVTIEEVREAIDFQKTENMENIHDIKQSITLLDQHKANISSINLALAQKADAILVEKQLSLKLSIEDFDKMKDENYVKKETLNTIMKTLQNGVEEIAKELKNKSTIKDVCKLLDLKTNTKQVDSKMGLQWNEISKKTRQDEFLDKTNSITNALEVLMQENLIGRWVWKSGDIRENQLVPWELQTSNTAPDHFVWDTDRTYILISQEGLYQVTFGLWSKGKSIQTARLILNGDILYEVNENNGVRGDKGLRNQIGLTKSEYVMIHKNSRVSLAYIKGDMSEGFLSIKRV